VVLCASCFILLLAEELSLSMWSGMWIRFLFVGGDLSKQR
jgi:hypothetical protein